MKIKNVDVICNKKITWRFGANVTIEVRTLNQGNESRVESDFDRVYSSNFLIQSIVKRP